MRLRRHIAEVDQQNICVVGIANTTTIRAAGGSLKSTPINAVTSVEEAVHLLRSGACPARTVAIGEVAAS
jgi:polar amino acid transport system substrate-binding protein